MAAVLIQQAANSEAWRESNPNSFDGGTSVTIDTKIRANSTGLNLTCATLFLDTITGTPIVADPVVTTVDGNIRVTFANTAAIGNKAAYLLEVERKWSASA